MESFYLTVEFEADSAEQREELFQELIKKYDIAARKPSGIRINRYRGTQLEG